MFGVRCFVVSGWWWVVGVVVVGEFCGLGVLNDMYEVLIIVMVVLDCLFELLLCLY